MKHYKHVLDPELAILNCKVSNTHQAINPAALFSLLNQASDEENTILMADEFIGEKLKRVNHDYSSEFSADYCVENIKALKPKKISALASTLYSPNNVLASLKQTTPIYLTELAWLKNTFQISSCQTSISLQLLTTYQQLTPQVTQLYASLLMSQGVSSAQFHCNEFIQQTDIMTEIFDFASTQLALTQFPRIYLAEILGFTLAYCQMPTLIEVCFPQHQLSADYFKQRQQLLEKQLPSVTDCIAEYMQLFPQQQRQLWYKIQSGFWLYQLLMQQSKNAFNQFLISTKPAIKDSHQALAKRQGRTAEKYHTLNNRQLYYYLINADSYPDVIKHAREKVAKILNICTVFNRLPFKHYSHHKFNNFIENIYHSEIDSYQPLQGKPKISKAAYIWGIEQIAPMILIDGCWLQRCQQLQNKYSEISRLLFIIYCDEIGNGQLKHNHPYIFQKLLDSQAITLPPVHTRAFINHARFINSAFDLPCFMLALGLSPDFFLAELLGLNMAIELSGLGKSYPQLVDEWGYWGIDATIANIHITVDNYETGHTLLAKKSIQLYMDEVMMNTSDTKVIDSHWKRIYTGYASLRFVGNRFKFTLPLYYLINKFGRKKTN